MNFKVGDKVLVQDVVTATSDSEPSVLTENGVWVHSSKVQHVPIVPTTPDGWVSIKASFYKELLDVAGKV